MSLEHVIPGWISDLFPNASTGAYNKMGISTQDPIIYPAEIFNQKVRAVCEKCNNGWMSRMEQSVKPFLGPMIHGGQTRLTRHDQRNLAAWAVKTALMFDCLHPKARQFQDADYRNFYATKRPTDRQLVWIAYRGVIDKEGPAGHQLVAAGKIESIRSIEVRNVSTASGIALQGAMNRGGIVGATLTIGRVALQLLSHDLSRKRVGYARPGRIVLPIWPAGDHFIWPTPTGIETIGGFLGLHDSLKAIKDSPKSDVLDRNDS